MPQPPKKTKNSTLKTPKDYEQLGRIVASVYESGYLDRNVMYKTSFVKGLLQGLGGAIGATVLVAVLIWVLSLFSQVPLLGRLTDSFKDTVESSQSRGN